MRKIEIPIDCVMAIIRDGLNATVYGLLVDKGIISDQAILFIESDDMRMELDAVLLEVAKRWHKFSVNDTL